MLWVARDVRPSGGDVCPAHSSVVESARGWVIQPPACLWTAKPVLCQARSLVCVDVYGAGVDAEDGHIIMYAICASLSLKDPGNGEGLVGCMWICATHQPYTSHPCPNLRGSGWEN